MEIVMHPHLLLFAAIASVVVAVAFLPARAVARLTASPALRTWSLLFLLGAGAWAGGEALGDDGVGMVTRAVWIFLAVEVVKAPRRPALEGGSRARRWLPSIAVIILLAAGLGVLWGAASSAATGARLVVGILALLSTGLIYARELELRAATERAALVRRLSHALRTPAAAIGALADALGAGAVEDAAERARFVALIRGEADRLGTGVDRLLRLARGEPDAPLRRAPLDLAEWAHATAARWRPRLPELRVEAPAALVASVDPERLDEAVDALLDNATRYGGARVTLSVIATGDGPVVAVADDGPGLDDRARARLEAIRRDPTALPDEAGARGFGLGLWAAHQVARAHGGALALDDAGRLVLSLGR